MLSKQRMFYLRSIVLFILLLSSSQPYAENFRTNDNQFKYAFSSGIFTVLKNARSIDWRLENTSRKPQRYRVTVYNVSAPEKRVVAPGPLAGTLTPSGKTHNANSVGKDKPFEHGSKYEVVVEVDSRKVLPGTEMWSGSTDNTVIPETVIQVGQFRKLH